MSLPHLWLGKIGFYFLILKQQITCSFIEQADHLSQYILILLLFIVLWISLHNLHSTDKIDFWRFSTWNSYFLFVVRSREIGNNPLIIYVSWPSISEPWAIISKSNIFKLWPPRAVGSVHKNNRVINIDFSLRKRLYPVIFESVFKRGSENS